jgi:hypothetical protein
MRQMLTAGVAATMWFGPLSANQSSQPARDRAQEHLALVEQAYAARQGPEGETWRGRVQSTEPDLERSLDWLMQNGEGEQALRFADAMNVFWTVFGESQHSRERLTQALAMPSASAPTPLRAKALYDAGLLAFRQGDEAASRALNEESLAVARRLNNKPATATALIGLSRIAFRTHDYAAVRRNADEALRVRQELGDVSGEMTAVHILAATARMEGDSAGASKFYELTLGIYGKDGNRSGVAGELMNLGMCICTSTTLIGRSGCSRRVCRFIEGCSRKKVWRGTSEDLLLVRLSAGMVPRQHGFTARSKRRYRSS